MAQKKMAQKKMAHKRKNEASEPGGAFTGPDHDPRTGIPDTGDVIGPDADDPNPPEVVNPTDPSFVDPAEVE